ncbi:MAG: OmpA family protein [Deltaproteobacteria bacterium]|nr:OmpA family protein [Deltaproteobacteria bacterium]
MTLLLALALGASAQDYTVDVERFRPMPDTYGYALTESAATLKHLQMGVGMWGNYSEDSVVMVWGGERVLGSGSNDGDGIIDKRSVTDLQVGIGLSRYFSFTVDAPVVLWQEGLEPSTADNPDANTELLSSGLMDLRLEPKLVLVDLDTSPVGLALLTQVNLPTGPARSFMGEGELSGMPMAVLEYADASVHDREYFFRMALNAGYLVRQPARFRDLAMGNEFVYRGAMALHPSPNMELGVDMSGNLGGTRAAQHALEVLPWFRVMPTPLVALTGGAGFGLLPGLGSPDVRLWLGATLAPSFNPDDLDRDKDGIPNKWDQCKNIPEDFDGFQDEDGCPELDNDRDTIPDTSDQCPDQPEDFDGYQDEDGCPDPDNDKDGIPDVSDQCIDIPENYNDYQDQDGCPDERPIYDTDGDGYRDDVDRCPFDAEDFDQWEDEDGCPEKDNDLDGIVDVLDACPNQRETFNGYEDEDGCPDEAPSRVRIEKERIVIEDKIFFEVNKTVIQVVSYDLLNEIAAIIVEHPEIRRIRVEGHTDSDGNDAYNLSLSEGRAGAVVSFLISAGVEADRLEPAGFGETRPIDTNDTEEGKSRNRRVEFMIVERD